MSWVICIAVLLGVVASAEDLWRRRVSNILTGPALLIGVIAHTALSGWDGAIDSSLGALIGFAVFFVFFLMGGMGGGDVKLIAMIGAFVGWQAVLVTIILSAFCGAISGLTLILLGFKGRRDPVPFGPFLAIGGITAMLWGEALLGWHGRWTLPF